VVVGGFAYYVGMKLPSSTPKILIVEDHPKLARMTARMVEEHGAKVIGPVHCCEDAFRFAERELPDAALVDLGLPDGSGMNIVHRLAAQGVRCAIVSVYPSSGRACELPLHAEWIEKPLSADDLNRFLAGEATAGHAAQTSQGRLPRHQQRGRMMVHRPSHL